MPSKETKDEYIARAEELFLSHSKIMVVGLDNVTSNQVQKIRASLRGKATLLCGKNTRITVALKRATKQNDNLGKLVPYLSGNVAFVFCQGDLVEIRDLIASNKVEAPARTGVVAPDDVHIPAGPTGMEPTQTSFLQALNIATKISKGQIDIINNVHLIHQGEKVTASQVALLQKLKIKPFFYGMEIFRILEDSSMYTPDVLDITKDDILDMFKTGISNIAAVSLQVGLPNAASVPHMIMNGVKNLLSIAVTTDVSFPGAEEIKAKLSE
ncbi:hypothetical protein P9112_000812 [Eukaryota sp. TZLM1-RC]